jgi:hypothetical protein
VDQETQAHRSTELLVSLLSLQSPFATFIFASGGRTACGNNCRTREQACDGQVLGVHVTIPSAEENVNAKSFGNAYVVISR